MGFNKQAAEAMLRQIMTQADGKLPFDWSQVHVPETEEAWAQMHCDWYNQSEGKLKGYDCPKCRNKGAVAFLRNGAEVHRICDCMEIRRSRQNIAASGLGEALRTKTFESYRCPETWQQHLKENVMRYAEKPRPQWLYLGGQTGAGKTHLCTAVCGALLRQGIQVQYEVWQSVVRDLSQFQTRQARFSALECAQVLYIDDFLKPLGQDRLPTDRAELSAAFALINARYAASRTTILSSELDLHDLISLDPALAGRIRERCGGYFFRISRDPKKNYRMPVSEHR